MKPKYIENAIIWNRHAGENGAWLRIRDLNLIQDNFGGMGTRYGLDDNGFPYYRKHYGDNIQDYEYAIFDDDSDFLLGQVDNFIRTDRLTGLTQADIDKAIKILNRENETEIH